MGVQAAPEPVPEPVLDPAIYTALRGGLPDAALIEIYTVFLADTESRIRTLLARADALSTKTALHAIRGSAGMIGARAVAAAARRLEQHGGALAPESVANLEADCRRLREALIAGGLAL